MAADETRTIIIDVEIPEKDFDQEIGKVNSAIRQNREEIKELSKDYDNNATAIAKLEAENRDLAKSKQQLTKESKTEANSLNALRLKVANLTKERNNLDLSSKEGVARFKELNSQILENTNTLKEAEEAGGDFRRSVGNYSKGIGEAVSGTQVFGTTLGSLFRLLLANPIILIVTALAALVKVFSETQAGAEFFRKTSAALNATLGLLKDLVEGLGVTLIEAFENPKQTLIDLVDTIKEGVFKFFNEFIPNAIQKVIDGFGLLGQAAKLIFEGEFSEALNVATEGALLLADGITDIIPGTAILKAAFTAALPILKEFAETVADASDKAFDLETRLIANEKALADLRVSEAKSIQSQKALNRTIEDQTKSFEERITAAEKFKAVEAAQLAESIELQEKRIAILKEQNEITNSTEEDIQRVRDAEIELANLLAASDERALTNANKLFGIRQQQEAQRQKLVDQEFTDIQKLAEAEAKAFDQEVKDEKALLKLKQDSDKAAADSIVSNLAKVGKLTKVATLTEIGQDTARAISGLVAASESNPANAVTFGVAGILQFIAGLARITANIASAKKLIKGGGGSTNLPTSGASGGISPVGTTGLANVNGSLLSQFSTPAQNQADQNAAIIEGISNMPQATVAVVDINKAQDSRSVKVGEAELG